MNKTPFKVAPVNEGHAYERPIHRAYKDPTADAAIGHIMWEEKQKARAMRANALKTNVDRSGQTVKLTRRQKTKLRTKEHKEKPQREQEHRASETVTVQEKEDNQEADNENSC